MQQLLSVMVVVWVLLLVCGGSVSSDESCPRRATSTEKTTCSKKASAMQETLETPAESESSSISPSLEDGESQVASPQQGAGVTDEVYPGAAKRNRCPERPTNDASSTTAKLHGSWRVVAAYSKEDMKAFCPELHMCLDPADFKKMTVFWTKAEPYGEILPRGHMTMMDNGNLEIPEVFDELQIVKVDEKFLIVRVWNSNFQRTFILSPLLDAVTDEEQESHENEVESNLFSLLIPMHVEMQMTDGPDWYICSLTGFPVRSSAKEEFMPTN